MKKSRNLWGTNTKQTELYSTSRDNYLFLLWLNNLQRLENMWHHFKNISTQYNRRKAQCGTKALKIHSITVVKRLIDMYLTKPPNPLSPCPAIVKENWNFPLTRPRVPMMSPWCQWWQGPCLMTGISTLVTSDGMRDTMLIQTWEMRSHLRLRVTCYLLPCDLMLIQYKHWHICHEKARCWCDGQ